MLRLGQQSGTRIVTLGSRNAANALLTRPRLFSSATSTVNSNKVSGPSATWFLGAGVVFSGVTLLIQSPSLGLVSEHHHALHNDSKTSSPPPTGGDSIGAKIAHLFKKRPPVDQRSIVLDDDLTVTSWKQQEQDALIEIPGVMLWGSNK
jgi:hypothetical protein